MYNRYYILLFVFITALAGCKKNELPEPIQEAPKIWVEFTLNGTTYKLTAGEDSTVVKTQAKINNSKRDFVFHIDAPSIRREFKVIVYNVPQTTTSSFDNVETELDRTIIPGLYSYGYSDGTAIWSAKQGDMAIEYTDDDYHQTYQTLPANQLQFSNFEILSVSNAVYEGQQYKLAEIRFNCLLKCHANGDYYKITDGKGVVVFGQ